MGKIDDDNLVPSVRRKKVTKERIQEAFEDTKPEETVSESEKFTGLIDIGDPKYYDPSKENYKRTGKTESGAHGFISVYMKKDEHEHLKRIADEHNMSIAAVIRKLIVNTK